MKLKDFLASKLFTDELSNAVAKQIKEKGLVHPDTIKEKYVPKETLESDYVSKSDYDALAEKHAKTESVLNDFEIEINQPAVNETEVIADEIKL